MRALWSALVIRSRKTSRTWAFELAGEVLVAPCLAHEALGAGAVAQQQQRARERELALGGERPVLAEIRAHGRGIEAVLPERRLGAAAQEADARPARIFGDEGDIAGEVAVVVVAAQDRPLDQLAGDRIADRASGRRAPRDALPLRASAIASLTAATSGEGVDAVAATASGASSGLLRRDRAGGARFRGRGFVLARGGLGFRGGGLGLRCCRLVLRGGGLSFGAALVLRGGGLLLRRRGLALRRRARSLLVLRRAARQVGLQGDAEGADDRERSQNSRRGAGTIKLSSLPSAGRYPISIHLIRLTKR